MVSLRTWKSKTSILALGAAMVFIQACSSGGSQRGGLAIIPQPLSVSPAGQAGTRWQAVNNSGLPSAIYIADAIRSIVDVFGSDGKLSAVISDGVSSPWGLFVDENQNLWVTNSDYVSMYPKGATKPSRTLSDPNQSPEDISVAKDGTVYVSNFFTGTVSVYAPGSNTPTRMLRDPKSQYTVGVASDESGDVFVTVNDYTGVGRLDEFVGGKQSGFKRLAPRFSFASDIKFDNAGNLLVLDETQFSVTEFTKTGHRTGLRFFTYHQWDAFDLSRDGKYIAGTVALPDQDRGVLKLFPSRQPVLYLTNNFNGGIGGIAIAP